MPGKSPAQFAKECQQFGNAAHTANRDGVMRAALLVTNAVAANMGGRSVVMRGVGRNGAKVSVGFDLKGTTNPTALVRMRGPAHLLERSTKPHQIGGKRRRGKGGRIKFPDGSVRNTVQHPGTKGKFVWARGVDTAKPLVIATFHSAAQTSLFKTFTRGVF